MTMLENIMYTLIMYTLNKTELLYASHCEHHLSCLIFNKQQGWNNSKSVASIKWNVKSKCNKINVNAHY